MLFQHYTDLNTAQACNRSDLTDGARFPVPEDNNSIRVVHQIVKLNRPSETTIAIRYIQLHLRLSIKSKKLIFALLLVLLYSTRVQNRWKYVSPHVNKKQSIWANNGFFCLMDYSAQRHVLRCCRLADWQVPALS